MPATNADRQTAPPHSFVRQACFDAGAPWIFPDSNAVDREKTRFLTPETLPGLFVFPADMARLPVEPNRLNNQALVRYFESEWRRVIR